MGICKITISNKKMCLLHVTLACCSSHSLRSMAGCECASCSWRLVGQVCGQVVEVLGHPLCSDSQEWQTHINLLFKTIAIQFPSLSWCFCKSMPMPHLAWNSKAQRPFASQCSSHLYPQTRAWSPWTPNAARKAHALTQSDRDARRIPTN